MSIELQNAVLWANKTYDGNCSFVAVGAYVEMRGVLVSMVGKFMYTDGALRFYIVGQAIDSNWRLESLLGVAQKQSFPFSVMQNTTIMAYSTDADVAPDLDGLP